MKNGEVLKEKSRMMIFDCIKMPAIYVRDYCTKCIHMVGTNEHDRLYLDDAVFHCRVRKNQQSGVPE